MDTAFVPALHGLRAIAALSVLMFHWLHYFPAAAASLANWTVPSVPWLNLSLPFAIGFQGVFLFFVLSGYLLAGQLQSGPMTVGSVARFYGRRFLRIYPAVWLQLAGFVAIATTWTNWPLVPSSQSWIANATLWINLPPTMTPPVNGVWWTLPVELGFYLLLPLLIALQSRFGVTGLLVVAWGVTFAWRAGVMVWFPVADLSKHLPSLDALPGVLSTFVVGIAVAQWQRTFTVSAARRAGWVGGLLFIVLQAVLLENAHVYWQAGSLLLVWNTFLATAMALILLSVCQGGVARWLGHPALIWAGDRSFGIYLWHVPAMIGTTMVWAGAGSSPFLAWALVMCCTFALAELSYRFVEKPVIDWGRRTFSR